MITSKRYPITPIPEPRQSRRDRFKPRACVSRYHAFKDEVRLRQVATQPSGDRIIFLLPMPASWSEKKRNQMRGQPHQQKSDTDNLLKALWDALYQDDQHLYHAEILKFWADKGEIIIQQCPKALSFDGDQVVWEE